MHRILLVAMCLLSSGCAGTEVVVPWRLTEAPSTDELSLVAEYGSSSCSTFREWRVSESETEVTIHAVVKRSRAEACTADLVMEPGVVRLQAPVGDRRLLGCRPDEPDAPCDDVEGQR